MENLIYTVIFDAKFYLLHLCVSACLGTCVCVCVTEREREKERTQNSECFIVEGHLTHYKGYDYKHAHTTYTKQLTNNTKQTDKTKRNRKKKQTWTKTTTTTTTKTRKHPTPTPTKTNKKTNTATKYLQCRQHTSDTCKSKHCHIWLNTHYWGGGGGGGSIHLHLCS